jgi:DNA-binding NtrC family response regulator
MAVPFFGALWAIRYHIASIISGMKPLQVLVVHRDTVRRNELAGLLRGADHRTMLAGSAGDAADSLAADVDAILLDLSLPDLDVTALRRALSPQKPPVPDSLEAAERRHLSIVLQHTAGNKRKAAHILGISRSTLLNKVRKYGLERH